MKVIVHNGDSETTEDRIDVKVDGNIYTPCSYRSEVMSDCDGAYRISNPAVLSLFLNQETRPYRNALDELRLQGSAYKAPESEEYKAMFQTVAKLCDAKARLSFDSDSGQFGPTDKGLTLRHAMYFICEAIACFQGETRDRSAARRIPRRFFASQRKPPRGHPQHDENPQSF